MSVCFCHCDLRRTWFYAQSRVDEACGMCERVMEWHPLSWNVGWFRRGTITDRVHMYPSSIPMYPARFFVCQGNLYDIKLVKCRLLWYVPEGVNIPEQQSQALWLCPLELSVDVFQQTAIQPRICHLFWVPIWASCQDDEIPLVGSHWSGYRNWHVPHDPSFLFMVMLCNSWKLMMFCIGQCSYSLTAFPLSGLL